MLPSAPQLLWSNILLTSGKHWADSKSPFSPSGTGWQGFPELPLGTKTFASLLLFQSVPSLGSAGTGLWGWKSYDVEMHFPLRTQAVPMAAMHLAVGKGVRCSLESCQKRKGTGQVACEQLAAPDRPTNWHLGNRPFSWWWENPAVSHLIVT